MAPSSASAATSCPLAAHRGYTAHASENGLRAMRYAIKRGADYLEMDVQATRDGHFVLMHDETVDRTTNGHGKVINKTWAQVQQLKLGDGTTVPSLDQVLALAKPTQTNILLEMKWIPTSRFQALRDLVADYGLSRVVVHSFSPYVAEKFHTLYPKARTGLDVSKPITVAKAKSYGGVLPDYRHSSLTWLRHLRTAGVPTYLATLNSADAWRRYTGKVTVVITDKVPEYRTYRDKAC